MSGATQITQADLWLGGSGRPPRNWAASWARTQHLSAIAWTVGPAGCVLAGRVNGLAPPGHVREVFGAWRMALALDADREQPCSGGTVYLHAAARRSEVKVRIIATVFEAGEDR